jgi:hypothetical protein
MPRSGQDLSQEEVVLVAANRADLSVKTFQLPKVAEQGFASLDDLWVVIRKVTDAARHGRSPSSVVSKCLGIMPQLYIYRGLG